MTNRLKIIGIIVLSAAILSIAQVISLLSVSDAAIISMAKAQAKRERDQGWVTSLFHSKTDSEINMMIDSRHDAVIENARKDYAGVIPLKLGFACLILAASLLLLIRKESSPPYFVMAVGIVQLLVLILSFSSIIRGLDRKISKIPIAQTALDMTWLFSLVLSAGACLAAFVLLSGHKKKDSQPGTSA